MQLLQIQARQIPHLDVFEMLPATALVKRTQIRSVAGDASKWIFFAPPEARYARTSPQR